VCATSVTTSIQSNVQHTPTARYLLPKAGGAGVATAGGDGCSASCWAVSSSSADATGQALKGYALRRPCESSTWLARSTAVGWEDYVLRGLPICVCTVRSARVDGVQTRCCVAVRSGADVRTTSSEVIDQGLPAGRNT
jgi:hypothetical protein